MNENIKTYNNFLQDFPYLIDILSTNYDNQEFIKSKYTLIKGEIQSGKSTYIRNIIISNFLQNYTSILILMNQNSQKEQFIDSMNEFIINKFNIDILTGERIKVDKNESLYKECLEPINNKPKLIILIANPIQLKKFNELLNKINNFKYILLIDEIDSIQNININNLYYELRNTINNAVTTYGFTATTFDVFFNEEELKSSRLFIIPNSDKYVGIDSISFQNLEYEVKSISKYEKQIDIDPNIFDVYDKLSNEKPIYIKNLDMYHPISILHKTSRYTKHHLELFNYFKNHYIFKEIWSIIIFNGKGIKLYSPLLKNKDELILLNETSKNKNNVFIFKSNNIRIVYKTLQELGSTHILTISGDLADRGINFVSDDYKIKLTHIYYVPSKMSTITNMIQSMRICGIYKYEDNFNITCICNKNITYEIKKAHQLLKELDNRIIQSNEDIIVKDYLQTQTINKSKIKFKHNLGNSIKKSDIKNKIIVIDDNSIDDGFNLNDFFNNIEENLNKNESLTESNITIDEIERLKHMFEIWKTKNTKISKFMKSFDPIKEYTEDEMKILCKEKKINISHLQHRDYNNKSKGYGLILETIFIHKMKYYRLYPSLIPIFNF
jgi:hypothetical protein